MLLISIIPLLFIKFYSGDSTSIVGISFITFRAISYIVEKYKDNIINVSFIDFLIYMLFFPTLVSGPIEKSSTFIFRINEKKRIDLETAFESFTYIFYGYLMKIILADRLILITKYVYSESSTFGLYCLLGVVAYSIYIYCDFAGYSYISFGTSLLFGYNVTQNFKQPYLSSSVKEFWTRWHISLSNWFKDYIYIPLGGSKKGKLKKYINILIVFAISGIWHGTGSGYLVWGLLNGLFQIVGQMTITYRDSICKHLKINNKLKKAGRILINFILISFTWIFFSEETISKAIAIIKSLFVIPSINLYDFIIQVCVNAESSKNQLIIIFVFTLIVIFIDIMNYYGKQNVVDILKEKPLLMSMILALLILSVLVFGKFTNAVDWSNFLYYNF